MNCVSFVAIKAVIFANSQYDKCAHSLTLLHAYTQIINNKKTATNVELITFPNLINFNWKHWAKIKIARASDKRIHYNTICKVILFSFCYFTFYLVECVQSEFFLLSFKPMPYVHQISNYLCLSEFVIPKWKGKNNIFIFILFHFHVCPFCQLNGSLHTLCLIICFLF